MQDVAIQIENLGKRYRLGARNATTLRDAVSRLGRRVLRRPDPDAIDNMAVGDDDSRRHIWAIRDLNFQVQRGDVVGIIGRNGAGKSTLLKILSQVTVPTVGRAVIHGRVGSLLEVGTGFHPELSGRENVFLNGAILGMTRADIRRRFDGIVEFSELDRFIDTPVKRYSSGMYTRLAFAVAAHLDPEILIVDEVLAVGDLSFQKKCMGKMNDVARSGRTVLFVSHNIVAVRKMCNRAVLLEKGRVFASGETEDIVTLYMSETAAALTAQIDLPPGDPHAPGEGVQLRFFGDDGTPSAQFRVGESWTIELEFTMTRPKPHVIAAIGITTVDNLALTTFWSKPADLKPGRYRVRFPFNLPVRALDLQFTIGISSQEQTFYYQTSLGHVSIAPIAVGEQPMRTVTGSGFLLAPQDQEIEPLPDDGRSRG